MFLWRSSSKCKASGTRSSDWSSVAFKLFKLHLDRATASTHASSMSRRKLQRASTHALTGHTPKSKSVSEDVIGSIVRASTFIKLPYSYIPYRCREQRRHDMPADGRGLFQGHDSWARMNLVVSHSSHQLLPTYVRSTPFTTTYFVLCLKRGVHLNLIKHKVVFQI